MVRNAKTVRREVRGIQGENITALPTYQIMLQLSRNQQQCSTFLSRRTSAKCGSAQHSSRLKQPRRGAITKVLHMNFYPAASLDVAAISFFFSEVLRGSLIQ
jgi:hypothetical protein